MDGIIQPQDRLNRLLSVQIQLCKTLMEMIQGITKELDALAESVSGEDDSPETLKKLLVGIPLAAKRDKLMLQFDGARKTFLLLAAAADSDAEVFKEGFEKTRDGKMILAMRKAMFSEKSSKQGMLELLMVTLEQMKEEEAEDDCDCPVCKARRGEAPQDGKTLNDLNPNSHKSSDNDPFKIIK